MITPFSPEQPITSTYGSPPEHSFPTSLSPAAQSELHVSLHLNHPSIVLTPLPAQLSHAPLPHNSQMTCLRTNKTCPCTENSPVGSHCSQTKFKLVATGSEVLFDQCPAGLCHFISFLFLLHSLIIVLPPWSHFYSSNLLT